MTVSERIFELIKERGYTQKEFSKKTGIAESTISDWKKKGTNPVSDKILMICEVLEVSPYFLLSGAENKGDRSRKNETLVVTKSSDPGELMACFEALDDAGKKEALEYLKKLAGKEPAKAAVSVKAAKAVESDKPKENNKPKEDNKPKTSAKPKDISKPAEKTPDKDDAKTKTPHLPDIKTIASEESDYLIKASEEENGNKKKKDKKDKKDKSGDKDKSKDKKKKDKDKSKDKGKDKKKKKKGYLLDR